jgi:hypothetical protein
MLPVDQSMYLISLSVAGGSTCPWKKEERRVSSSQNADMITMGGTDGKKDAGVTRPVFAYFAPQLKEGWHFNVYPTMLFPSPVIPSAKC